MARVEQDPDNTISKREDMIEDLLDCLSAINSIDGYNTDPKLNALWRVDELQTRDMPANIIFDQESTVEDRGGSFKHTLLVTIEHVTSEGSDTCRALNKGISDVLRAMGEIHQRFCEKYSLDKVTFVSTLKGVESLSKTNGCMDVVFEIKYNTAAWRI